MGKQKKHCWPLEFARTNCIDAPWIHNLDDCERAYIESERMQPNPDFAWAVAKARDAYTVNRWLDDKQCYSITRELAEDLFSMEDLSFPLDALHLPFPCFYLDLEPLGMEIAHKSGSVKILGHFVLIGEVPNRRKEPYELCSVVTLGQRNGEVVSNSAVFDCDSAHMSKSLGETVDDLSGPMPEMRDPLAQVLLFAAYISSARPDVQENPEQQAIYRPTRDRLRYASMRKWDAGVRYTKEKRRYMSEQGGPAAGAESGRTHSPVRAHIRKAHWHTYRVGPGRQERRVLWLSPITVGIHDEDVKDLPVVVRKLKDK